MNSSFKNIKNAINNLQNIIYLPENIKEKYETENLSIKEIAGTSVINNFVPGDPNLPPPKRPRSWNYK